MDKRQNDEIEIDLLEIFQLLKFRIGIIVMVGVIFAALVGLCTTFIITPKYQSTSKLYVVGGGSTITSLTDLQAGASLTQDYMVLVEGRPVLEKVINNLGLDMTYEQLREMVSLNNPTDTRILELTVTTNDPYMAKEIVDEIATVSSARIKKIMDVEEPTIAEKGHIEESPTSPSIKKNVLIGGMAGVVLSAVIIIVLYILDDTLKTSEDVEKYLGLNTLGIIPLEEGSRSQMIRDKKKRKKNMKE